MATPNLHLWVQTPIIDYKGKEEGDIHIKLSLHGCCETPDGDIPSEGKLDSLGTGLTLAGDKALSSFIGQKIFVKVRRRGGGYCTPMGEGGVCSVSFGGGRRMGGGGMHPGTPLAKATTAVVGGLRGSRKGGHEWGGAR